MANSPTKKRNPTGSFTLTWGAMTDCGRDRNANQDAYFADADRGFFIVSDGMGGEQAGALASEVVVKVLPQMLRQRTGSWHKLPETEAREKMRVVLSDLSELVRQRTEGQPGLDGMGATAVLALVRGRRALVAHMGDSRAYLFRKGRLERLTKDHSVVQLLVDSGDLSPEEAHAHPARGQLTRFVGMKGEPLPEVRDVRLEPGDRLLLCTDGLTNMVADEQLGLVLAGRRSLQRACKVLMTAANSAGGKDNITAVLVGVPSRTPRMTRSQ